MFWVALVVSYFVTQPSNAEELSCSYVFGGEVYECLDLSKQNYAAQNLETVFWAGANLFQANLSHANLSHAYLMESNMTEADLTKATLYGAKLYGANLSFAILTGANLNGSHLEAADLSQAIIDDTTSLNGAAFSRKTTKLPLAWGKTLGERYWEAVRRGMLPIRE